MLKFSGPILAGAGALLATALLASPASAHRRDRGLQAFLREAADTYYLDHFGDSRPRAGLRDDREAAREAVEPEADRE